MTDNKEEASKTITFPSNRNRTTINEYENDGTISNTQESKLWIANEKSPVIMMDNVKQSLEKEESQESSGQLDIYFSCHERMVNGDYFDCENTEFKGKF